MKRLNVVSEIADVIAATYCGDEAMQSAHAILSRLDQLGLVVVPREPSEAMIKAVHDAELDVYWSYQSDGRPGGPEDAYLAMINAALSDTRIEDAGLPKLPVLRIEGLDE